MAKEKKEKKNSSLAKASSGDLTDLIGNSVAIKLPDGSSIIVPADKSGNRVANMVMAANIRHLIENSIKTYRDKEMLPTPKDLKDLAGAAAEIAKFSGEIYKEEEAVLKAPEPKKPEKASGSDDLSFDSALEPKPEETK